MTFVAAVACTLSMALPLHAAGGQPGGCGETDTLAADVSAIEIHGQPQWRFWEGAPLIRDSLLAVIPVTPPGSRDGQMTQVIFTLPDSACWSVWAKARNGAGVSACESPMVEVNPAGFVTPPTQGHVAEQRPAMVGRAPSLASGTRLWGGEMIAGLIGPIAALGDTVAHAAADSAVFVNNVGALIGGAIDAALPGLDPKLKLLVLGFAVSALYPLWKKVVDPNTKPFPALSAWWEANRAWLNVIAPAAVTWLLAGHSFGPTGLLALFASSAGDGLRNALVSVAQHVIQAPATKDGQRNASAAAMVTLFALAGLLGVTSETRAQGTTPAPASSPPAALVSHFHPTLSAGLAQRWGVIRRGDNVAPAPYLILQPGVNWNDRLALRGRVEHAIDRSNLWAGEVGVFWVIH